jgi:hypothetical protein
MHLLDSYRPKPVPSCRRTWVTPAR